MSQIYLDLLRDKIDQKMLIYVYVIRRAGRLPVVEIAQNDLGPNSVFVFQIPYLAGGKPQRENFLAITTTSEHLSAISIHRIPPPLYPMILAIRSLVITIFFPMM